MIKRLLPMLVAGIVSASLPATAAAATEDYRISEKPLEMTIHMHFRDKYAWDENWPVARKAAELTGITLKGVASRVGTNSQEMFNLMMVTGDLPDVVGGDALKDNFFKYGMEGAFLPLNDLIDEHAPHLKQMLADNPAIKKAITAPDGNIYYIPYIPDGKAARGYFIRQDWLDKLGLQQPQNVDELHAVLTAFRNQDPNGNGKMDEVPYFARQWPELIRLVTLWDARSTGSDAYHEFYIKDDTVRFGYADPEYRVAMRNLAQWYKEGLIDQEVFTRGARSREFLLGNDLGGMTHDWFASTSGYNESLADKVPGINLVPFAPPASPTGVRMEENGRIEVKPDGWAISHANEHPVETIKYFDFVFTDTGRKLFNFGVEGEHWNLVDGKATYTPEVLGSDKPVNAQMWEIGAQIPVGFHMDYAYERQWTNDIALAGIDLYEKENYIIPQFSGIAMTVEERKVYDKHWPNILTYMLETQQAWILGSRDVDADWDSYMQRINDLGFEKVQAALQSGYNRQYR
ncbi:sugar ABC transporter permease [Marinobacterium aestuarii]|uniref:Sugar ABC transporter permease n=1 Tax=Marinobacterium aestuarii TaxID=1821621 RepID=A0A1A9ETC3_9GAMM|nr:extracellular solute-binding protein [Marinobacterium aestuarii]ANG61404.1 sugar ABC transporter permease [Marinobacterium aestuarii]